jgi:hypothetical protein
MKPTFTHWKGVVRRAFKETTFFAVRRMIVSLALALIALGIQWAVGLQPRNAVWKILPTVVVPYILVVSAAYLWHLIKIPAAMHSDQASEISRLKDIACPKVTAEEEIKRKIVIEAVHGFHLPAKRMLRCIMTHGRILVPVLCTKCGIKNEEVYNFIHQAQQGGLIFQEREIVSINEGPKAALNYVLNLEGI